MIARLARGACGQTLVEAALVVPIAVMLVLGVVELGYALLDQHVVTRLAREGSNLISRSATLEDASAALKMMSTRPVDFDAGSKLIFSVLKRGATTGTVNYDQLILYQRYEYGTLAHHSVLQTAGPASFAGPPDYTAVDSDNDPNLQIVNAPENLVVVRGGLIYVAEIYSAHRLVTPVGGLGVVVPSTLYSAAYF